MPRKKTHYWIDGYNVIFRLKLGEGEDLERRRGELVARVAALGGPAWIVFDTREGEGRARTEWPFRRVKVQFARAGQSADAVIAARVGAGGDLGDVVVVTDDRELAGLCRQHGATVMGVRAFGALLKPLPEPPPKGSQPLSAEQIEEWKRYFGVEEPE
ncbi:MAG: NYN domain-containing protein [Planctomycetota bacterium]